MSKEPSGIDQDDQLGLRGFEWLRNAGSRVRVARSSRHAAGAYPVRLSPRHLRQLAQSQDELDGGPVVGEGGGPSSEMIRRIHAAWRASTETSVAMVSIRPPVVEPSLAMVMKTSPGEPSSYRPTVM